MRTTMNQSVITSLAILKVNFEHGKDYIDNFVPFVVECARLSPDDVVSLPQLQTSLTQTFGLFIPLNPLRQILHRAQKQGFFYPDAGILYRNKQACESTGFAERRAQMTSNVAEVIVSLRTFAKEKHSLDLTQEEAEKSLLSFLGSHGLELVYAAAEQRVFAETGRTFQSSFLVADFLSAAQAGNPHLFSQVDSIVRGALLANALYLPDQSKIAKKFRRTSVFLDSTILIYALGYAGLDRKAPCFELITLLRQYGANLRCFVHTIEEMRRILDACSARIRRLDLADAFGPSMEYFIANGLRSSDIDLYSARLESDLAGFGIIVEEKPAYVSTYNIAERDLEDFLSKEIGYHNPLALQHDVDCLAGIARLRQGRHSHVFEESAALFVTSNGALASAARTFFKPELPPGAVSICISDYALGNILWLKNPTKAPQLPKKLLIADVYAALEPSDELWKNYLIEIARLERAGTLNKDDYMLLRHHQAAKRALMDLTKGQPSVFTQGTVAEILEVAKRNVRSDLDQALQTARRQASELQRTLDARIQSDDQKLQRLKTFCDRLSRVCTMLPYSALMILLIVGTLYSFPWALPSLTHSWFSYLLTLAQVFLFVFGILGAKSGHTIDNLRSTINRKLSDYFFETARSLLFM